MEERIEKRREEEGGKKGERKREREHFSHKTTWMMVEKAQEERN